MKITFDKANQKLKKKDKTVFEEINHFLTPLIFTFERKEYYFFKKVILYSKNGLKRLF